MTDPTQRPWAIRHNYLDRIAIVGPANDGKNTTDDRIGNLPQRKNGEGEANARLIVRAVNCHDELVDVLKRAQYFVDMDAGDLADDMLDDIRAALAKVEEQS